MVVVVAVARSEALPPAFLGGLRLSAGYSKGVLEQTLVCTSTLLGILYRSLRFEADALCSTAT